MRVRLFCATAMVAALTLPLAVAAQAIPAPSVWRLDTSASEFGGQPAPKLEELTILESSDSSLRWKMHEVDPQGEAHDFSWDGAPDGKPRPVNGGSPGEMASFSGNTMHFIEPDGSVSDGSYTLSPDGKVWTHSSTFKTKEGQTIQTKSVFHRVS